MKVFIELWKAKEAWHQLPKDKRGEYLGAIGPALGEMLAGGMEVVNWGTNDPNVTHRGDYDFYSVMKFPDAELVAKFEALVEGAGWYNYFDQINVSGTASDPETVIGQLIEL